MIRSLRLEESMRRRIPDDLKDWKDVVNTLGNSCSKIEEDINAIKAKQVKRKPLLHSVIMKIIRM